MRTLADNEIGHLIVVDYTTYMFFHVIKSMPAAELTRESVTPCFMFSKIYK